MCIASVYYTTSKEKPLMQDVVSLENDQDFVHMVTILGEKKSVRADIKLIDFLKHTVIIESK